MTTLFPIWKKFSRFSFSLTPLTLVLVNSILFCQPQWVKRSPLPFAGSLNSVYYIDSNTGWIACDSGKVYKSTDGGYNYEQQLTSTTNNLKDISFSDENYGWAVGVSSTIINTTDGGDDWNPQTNPLGGDFVRVKGVTDNIAYACGTNGLIKTTNGGALWTSSISGQNVVSLAVVNSLVVWAVTAHSVYKTMDGGANWTDETDAIFDGTNVVIAFYDAMHGFLGTRYTTSFYTTDGGSNWNYASITDPDMYEDIVDFSFANNGNGWGIKKNTNGTNYVTVYKTTDYGADWTGTNFVGESETLNKIYALDDDNVWTVGQSGLNAKWDNNVGTWEYIGVRSNYGVHSFNDSTAIVFQVTGTGYHDDDGFAQVRTKNYGKSWYFDTEKIFSWNDVFFFLHQFIDNNNGWIFANGPFFHTTDGGDNYSSISPSIIPENLSSNSASMFFVNFSDGWISTNGTVQQTTDGGDSWTPIYTILGGDNYVSMSFISSTVGFGLMGTSVFKTTNGGTSWTDIGLVNTKDLNKIEFFNSTLGFIVGNEGTIFRSTDGGTNWSSISIAYNNDLSFLHFVDVNNGWAGSSDGLIIQSTNGGDDWNNTSYPGEGISDMSFPSINYGYVVYGKNLYLYTKDGSVPVELSSFTASVLENKVELNWATATEINNFGYDIQRSQSIGIDNKLWTTLGFVKGHGNATNINSYQFIDSDLKEREIFLQAKTKRFKWSIYIF